MPPRSRSSCALTACLALLAGCRPAPHAVVVPPAHHVEPGHVLLGAFATLSGPGAAAGLDFERGLKRAIAQVNAQGGIRGRPVAVEVFDDRASDEGARLAGERLEREVRAIAILTGPDARRAAIAAAAAADTPLVCAGCEDQAAARAGAFVLRARGAAAPVEHSAAAALSWLARAFDEGETWRSEDLIAALRAKPPAAGWSRREGAVAESGP